MKAAAVMAFFLALNQSPLAKVLDDFEDNKVTGWEKFDFGTGNGFFEEEDGQFTIGMHQPTGQPFFVAATHTGEKFTIEDGITLEFRLDLITANQLDAFAVMGFLPSDTPVSQLNGYSLAKDGNDVLLAKGLNNRGGLDRFSGKHHVEPDDDRQGGECRGDDTGVRHREQQRHGV